MADVIYSYSIATDTANAKVSTSKLSTEISDSSIILTVNRIDTEGDVLKVVFDSTLESGDETTLNGLVSGHDGAPIVVSIEPLSVTISDKDGDTLGIPVTTRFSPDGFYQRLHEVEFTTSTEGGDLHDRDIDNLDTGWSSVDFYEDIAGVETLMASPTQVDLDTKCIRTDFRFMPDLDYMVKSGVISHQELIDVDLNGEIYMWGKMLDVDSSLNAFGIFPITVLSGGMAMSFVNPRDPVGLKGVNGSMLYYGGVMSGDTFIPTGDGNGTNRITFLMRHNAGIKQRFQAIFEIFRPI